MKIRIRDNASALYVQGQKFAVNWEWAKQLEQIQGMTLEVETEFLFKDQFNTGPIEGVSGQGMRVMVGSVAEIIDDIRPRKMRCQWCGKISDIGNICEHCKKTKYLERLSPPWTKINR